MTFSVSLVLCVVLGSGVLDLLVLLGNSAVLGLVESGADLSLSA